MGHRGPAWSAVVMVEAETWLTLVTAPRPHRSFRHPAVAAVESWIATTHWVCMHLEASYEELYRGVDLNDWYVLCSVYHERQT